MFFLTFLLILDLGSKLITHSFFMNFYDKANFCKIGAKRCIKDWLSPCSSIGQSIEIKDETPLVIEEFNYIFSSQGCTSKSTIS